MDDGAGRLREVTPEQAEVAMEHKAPVFQVGAKVEMQGSTFRIRKITKKDLILRLCARR